jgi:hypothetical protein
MHVRPLGTGGGSDRRPHREKHSPGPNQPPPSLLQVVLRADRASIGVSPVHHRRVVSVQCIENHSPIPRAPIGTSPLQHGQVPTLSCVRARLPIPRAAIGTSPLKHGQMAALSRARARTLQSPPAGLPHAAVRSQPAQRLELPGPRRADKQLGTERHAARCGPLKLAHRAERRVDPRGEPRARRPTLGASDRLA